ncbi:signal transducer and activator of transcription 6 isoform 2-T3 [Pholidichthys leucotaenia]
MAQWKLMTQILQFLPDETVNNLYPPASFPIEVRHYIADWIEIQRWEDFTVENNELESQARVLLDQTISMLQSIAQQTPSVVERMKLNQCSRNMEEFQQQPLRFVVMVKDILREERTLLIANNFPQYQSRDMEDLDLLIPKVLEIQETRKRMHQKQEERNWQMQIGENLQVNFQQNGLDTTKAEIQKLQKHIQSLEFDIKAMTVRCTGLLKECVDCLDHSQAGFLIRLKKWRCDQQRSAIGHPFDNNLIPLQTWCEQLLGLNGNLRQELMLIGISDLQERLQHLLRALIESSLVFEKQPPQVIKTQSKFSATVRCLLGEKIAFGKPVMLKAQIINEQQARNLYTSHSDNVGDLINNSAILEHNTATKSTCAFFRNMSIKKIKRADRKGSESVTEEKFALLFSTELTITGCDTPYKIQIISLPVVVTVHGSQDNNALATIIWDCAFSEQDRVPFVVPDRVTWSSMFNTLNMKFTSEVRTKHNLDPYNQHFLAQKIFDKPDFGGDFSNMMVSWAQFNKDALPGRSFTFWQWFEGVMELTKKHLEPYWSEGLIFGFIGKQHLNVILKDRPNGTFLLRFSDSEIGGITIAYVSATENGGQRVQNIQPFTKRDLEIRGLGNRICDIDHITHLYPDYLKHEVFKKFYSEPPPACGGYIPVSLQTKVGMDATPQPPNTQAVGENSPNMFPFDAFQQFNQQEIQLDLVNSPAQSVFNETMSPDDMTCEDFPFFDNLNL